MNRYAKESLICTAIFCLGYMVACARGNTAGGGANPPSRQMVSSDLRRVALVQGITSIHSVMAAFLSYASSSAGPNVTISNPSAVGQSYESDCRNFSTGEGQFGGIHATFGSLGLVSMNYTYGTVGACLQPQPLTAVGSDEKGIPQGYPIILDGTINTIEVYGTFVSGNRFRCVDTTNTSPLSDGSFVRAYYDLASDAIILGSGTTQLSLKCSISIPPGDDVSEIHVQWLKS